MVGLILFVVQVLNDTRHEATLLEDIKEHSYPTQAHLLAALHSLEFIHRELENAVTTGDEDAARQTDQLAKTFRQHLAEVKLLSNDSNVDTLLRDFEAYHRGSKSLAIELMNPFSTVESLLSRGRENSEKYSLLTQQLKMLYGDSKQQFAEGIGDATSRATETVRFAISGGLLIVALVLAIAIVTANSIIRRIREMVETLKSIALEDGDLKVRIALTGRDEMTELAYWFNGIIKKLEDTSHKAEQDVLRIANTDELSGLFNRRYLINWLQERTERQQGTFSLLFLDLDDFKPINDTLGHEAGDDLIAMVAQRLQSVVESYARDVPSLSAPENTPVVGRLGGDEFMVIMPLVTDRETIEDLVIDIRNVITEPYIIESAQCKIGVSVGISRYPEDATDRDALLDRADLAMYQAKRSGKARFAFYDKHLRHEHSFRNNMERLLKRPEFHSELSLVYQPKFRLRDGSYIGAEALLRWNSPELGEVSPMVFIPFAEEKQLITDIDLWVLNAACKQISEWRINGFESGKIAINLSAKTLRLPSLHERVADVLQTYQLPATALQIEITESAILDLNTTLTDTIHGLRDLGVSIAMDDFGAGHSSLMLLMGNQIDLLKLDKSLINNINDSTRRQKIVQSIVLLAENLGVATLAEGIETKDQWDYLQSVNCIEGQGYFYSKPLSVQSLIDQFFSDSAIEAGLNANQLKRAG